MADELALVEQVYSDFARGDVPAVLAVLADDVQWFEAEGNPWWPGHVIVGPQAVVKQVLARIGEEYEDFSIHVERFVGAGETVLVQARYRGRAKATGRELDAQVAHVWDVRDGKVIRFQQYVDTAQLREVLGV